MKQNRSILKDYFKKGLIPTEANFADLIDSMLNQQEDNISQPVDDALRIAASGVDEVLLSFMGPDPAAQDQSNWQVKQKPDGKSGLSVSDATASRLFIESGSGKVGIGTTTPAAGLDVNGNTNLSGSLTIGSVQLNSFTDAETDEWPKFVWYRDVNKNWDEGLIKHGADKGKFGRAGYGIHFHETREFGFYSTNWNALFSVAGQSGDGFFKGKLEVGGDLKVDGNVISANSVYAGGNPVVYENFEISICGSAFESTEGSNTFLEIANVSMGMDTLRGLNTVILKPNGAFKAKANYDVWGKSSLWNDWATWVNTTAANGDIVAVASFDALNNAVLGDVAESLLRSIGAVEAFSAVKGNNRSPYMLLFVKGGTCVEVSIPYKGPNARLKTSYYDLLNNVVRGDSFIRRGSMYHRMYPANPVVYQDIFAAKNANVIVRLGNAPYDETTYTSANLWNQRTIIEFGGTNDPDGNGAQVTVPPGYDTVWLRVLGDRWTAVKAYFMDGAKENLGMWVGGFRGLNCFCPDGSLSDGVFGTIANGQYLTLHQWMPIPVGRAGKLALVAKPNSTGGFWLSGIAFSRNPWAHATQSAAGYSWPSNGGDPIKWNNQYWNGDILAELTAGSNSTLSVPVVPNGHDKLLYLVEHNDSWNGAMHSAITVNGQPIERFLASYENPFARHWNNKIYERYMAAHIPASMILPGQAWLKVQIDMTRQAGNSIYFREIGTHDLDLPLG